MVIKPIYGMTANKDNIIPPYNQYKYHLKYWYVYIIGIFRLDLQTLNVAYL